MKPLETYVGYSIIVREVDAVRENGDFDAKRQEAWKVEGADMKLEARFQELLEMLSKESGMDATPCHSTSFVGQSSPVK